MELEPGEPFYCRDTFNTPEECVNAIVLLHQSGGVDQLTMSAVARRLRMARASVHQAHGSLAGFYVSLVARFGYRWWRWVADDFDDPSPIRLPRDEMARLGVLTWSSLRSVAAAEARAGRPEAWAGVTAALARERSYLAGQIHDASGRAADDAELNGLMALADGLRARMTAPAEPLSHADASAIVARYWTTTLDLPFPRPPDDEAA